MDDARQDQIIVDSLRGAVDGLVAVYRFGSTVRGVTSESSDIDIAVLAAAALGPDSWFTLQERLTRALGVGAVDLLDLATASPVLAVQVVFGGRLLYDSLPAVRGRFEDEALISYAWLNEDRREILARIHAEGTVYGR